MKLLLPFLLIAFNASAEFTEFYCQTTGDNLNAGSTTSDSAAFTYASGDWVQSTGVFTPASGNPQSDGVAVGDWASVYPDGSTVAVFVGRVTARDTTTITVSLLAKSGTAPADGTGNRTLKIGGAWDGPDGAVVFPFNFVEGALTNAAGNSPRINVKGTYYAGPLTESGNNGPVWWQGYTNAIDDGGFANFYGSNNVAGYVLLTISGKNRVFSNFQFATNGNSGNTTQHGVLCSSSENLIFNCVAHDMRVSGFAMSAASTFIRCEAWNNNLGNSSSFGGFYSGAAGCIMINCFSHHNLQANSSGFQSDGTQMVLNCISVTNGADGFRGTGDVQLSLVNCVSAFNGGAGVQMVGASGPITDPMNINFINCLFVGNAKSAVTNNAATAYYSGTVMNNGFGSGSVTNALGDVEARLQGVTVTNNVTLELNLTPWMSPVAGDYRITGTRAKAAGFGGFLQTYPVGTWSGTIAYPDIGSAQSSSRIITASAYAQ